MRHFILASHGTFSEGIYNSVKIIMGEQKNVNIITAYVNEGEDVCDLIQNTLSNIDLIDEVIVVTDVFGGSVNNEMMKYLKKDNFHLVTGMNLPLLMNLFIHDDENISTMIRQSIQEAKDGLLYCNDMKKDSEEEEF